MAALIDLHQVIPFWGPEQLALLHWGFSHTDQESCRPTNQTGAERQTVSAETPQG
jgi:hypothetical protein